MQPARVLAIAATVANLLQGWDNGAIAGALLYLKPEFGLNATLEGLVVASSLAGAWVSTLLSGPGADWLGRRKMLCIAAGFFFISSFGMAWSPNVYVLIFSRLVLGGGVGLSVTIVPIYIAETAPSEIRGNLLTFPQLMGSVGQVVAYILVFGMSLTKTPVWRYMVGMLCIPAAVNLVLALFYLSESPRWLVSKGEMLAARRVLQMLRNRLDVAAELALLVEGLGVGADTSFEEWQLKPAEGITESSFLHKHDSTVQLYNPEEGVSWIATSVDHHHGLASRRGSMMNASIMSMKDPVVTLFGSFHSTYDNAASTVFGTFHSTHGHLPDGQPEIFEDKNDQWDHEDDSARTPRNNGYQSDDGGGMVGDMDEHQLSTPFLQRQVSGKSDMSPWLKPRRSYSTQQDASYRDYFSSRQNDLPRGDSRDIIAREQSSYTRHSSVAHSTAPVGSVPDSIASVGIGGGWQLAWQWVGTEGQEGNPEEGHFKRVFLLQEPGGGGGGGHGTTMSSMSLPGVEQTESIQAAAIVGQPALYAKDSIVDQHPIGPAMVHPSETAVKGPAWSDLLEGGVRRALVVGVGLQIFQQFSGINAVQSFIPQILQQSGASALITNMGVGPDSASILASAASSVLMLPCILVAMRLMDTSGRRQLLLATLPVLLIALMMIVVSNMLSGTLQAGLSFIGVATYICTFVMGFGPIPNILGSEIFPTKVRGVCIGLCQATMWTCNIIVTNLFPTLLVACGIGGVFGMLAVVVLVAWFFVFLKVPETKGMPLEVISEFFAMSAIDTKTPAAAAAAAHKPTPRSSSPSAAALV